LLKISKKAKIKGCQNNKFAFLHSRESEISEWFIINHLNDSREEFSEIQSSHEKKGKVVSDCFSQETVCLQILINFSWIFLSTPATRICLNNVPVGEGEGVPEPAHLKIYMGKRRGLVYLYRTELPVYLKTCLLPLFPLYSLV
jgi:hypothetical protein